MEKPRVPLTTEGAGPVTAEGSQLAPTQLRVEILRTAELGLINIRLRAFCALPKATVGPPHATVGLPGKPYRTLAHRTTIGKTL